MIDDRIIKAVAEGGYIHDHGINDGIEEGYKPYYDYLKYDNNYETPYSFEYEPYLIEFDHEVSYYNEPIQEIVYEEQIVEDRNIEDVEIRKVFVEEVTQAQLDAERLANDIRLEEENKKLVELQSENEKKKSDAKAYDSEVLLRTFENVDTEVIKALAACGMDSKALIAKAFVEIGDKADKIGTLNVSPDLLETLTK